MRQLDVPNTIKQLTLFIKQTVTRAGFSKIVVAVSGGVDSATALSLAVKALGKEYVYVLLLPYKNWHPESVSHARILLKQLEVPLEHIYEVNIASMVDSVSTTVILGSEATPESGFWTGQNDQGKVRLGNVMARVRMIVLFDQAKKLNALVLGTENRSEHLLGYYTRFGDEASDVEPLRNLYKTEVYELAKFLEVPQEIISKAPTAGLWQDQTDEGQFDFTYKEADKILYGLFEAKISKEELVTQGLNKTTIEKVQAWVKSMEFKHHLPLLAPKPKILEPV